MTVLTHEEIVGASPDDEPDLPRIGHENFFRTGTVTVSSEDAAHPKELAYDGFTYDGWRTTGGATEWIAVDRGSAQSADYLAIAAHTLTGCDLTPQHSDDGSSWSNIESAYTAVDNRPIVWEFASVSKRHWRLLIENAAAAVSLGAIHVGLKLQLPAALPVGWQPPTLNEKIEYSNVMSQGGQLLGRNVVRRGAEARVTTDPMTYLFARDEWLTFLETAERFAVFFWWSMGDQAEILYGGITDPSAQFTGRDVSAQFQIEGINR